MVVGNCGSSPWPARRQPECALDGVGGDPEAMDPRVRPRSATTSTQVEAARPAVNIAALVGHGAVRELRWAWIGARPPPDELDRDAPSGRRGRCEQGAVGLSTGLDLRARSVRRNRRDRGARTRPPARQAASTRPTSAARERTCSGPWTRPSRSDAEPRLPAHVSHLKCESSFAWGRAEELLDRFHGDADVDRRPVPVRRVGLGAVVAASRSGRRSPSCRVARRSGDPCSRLSTAVERGEGDAFQSSVDGVGWDRIVIEPAATAAGTGAACRRSPEPARARTGRRVLRSAGEEPRHQLHRARDGRRRCAHDHGRRRRHGRLRRDRDVPGRVRWAACRCIRGTTARSRGCSGRYVREGVLTDWRPPCGR